MSPRSQSQVLEPLGLVAGMFDALGLGEGLDQAMAQDLTKRTGSLGHAVNAMGLKGLGVVHPQRSLAPSCFQPKPLERRLEPGMHAASLTAAVLGRPLEARYTSGGPPLSSSRCPSGAPRRLVVPRGVSGDDECPHRWAG
jgi:hypothetical protein